MRLLFAIQIVILPMLLQDLWDPASGASVRRRAGAIGASAARGSAHASNLQDVGVVLRTCLSVALPWSSRSKMVTDLATMSGEERLLPRCSTFSSIDMAAYGWLCRRRRR